MFKNKSITLFLLKNSLIVILLIGVTFGAVNFYNEYLTYKEIISNIEKNYLDIQKGILKRHVDDNMDFIQVTKNFEEAQNRTTVQIQKEILKHLELIRFTNNGSMFVMNNRGVILYQPVLTNMTGLKLFNLNSYNQNNLNINQFTNNSELYFQFSWDNETVKLAYRRILPEWGWILAAQVDMNALAKVMKQRGNEFYTRLVRNTLLLLVLILLFISISFISIYHIAKIIKKETDIFASFFQYLSKTHMNINRDDIHFSEFKTLSDYANQMNEEIVQQKMELNFEIETRKKQQLELSKFSNAVVQSPAIVMITDLNGDIDYVNPKFTQITGFTYEEVKGKNPRFLKSDCLSRQEYERMWTMVLSGEEWRGEFCNIRKNGAYYWENASIIGIRDDFGKIQYLLKVSDDITERKKLEQKLEYMAHHDPLTGLSNRTLFFDRLKLAISMAKRSGKFAAVMIIDLDYFKHINDNYGHDAGDLVLKSVVNRFIRHIRDVDTASRIGGDEFAIVFNDIDSREIIDKIARRIMDSFQEPFEIFGKQLKISPSIGISFYPVNGETIESLMKNADIALYQAKQSGRSNFKYYQEKS